MASAHGRYGSVAMYMRDEAAIEAAYAGALEEGVRLLSALAAPTRPEHWEPVRRMAVGLANEIVEHRRIHQVGSLSLGRDSRLDDHLERLRGTLSRQAASVLGDAKFGIVGGERMVQSGPVHNAVTIQDVSNSIITVIQSGHVGDRYRELGTKVAGVLNAPELQAGLTDEQRDEISDLAGHVRDELAKANPEESRVKRAIDRVGRALGAFGKATAQAALGKIAADFLTGA